MFGMPLGMLAFFGLIVVVALVATVSDWRRKRRVIGRLGNRPPLDDEQFRQAFYAGRAEVGDIAVRVRRVLEEDLRISLAGLRPDDHLNGTLDAGLESNPLLFLSLEHEFGFDSQCDDFHVFETTAAQIGTFSDLVEFVIRKIEAGSENPSRPPATVRVTERIYEITVKAAPALCAAGITIAIAGRVLDFERMWPLGTLLFMFGIVLVAVSFIGVVIENLTVELREQGTSWLRQHPVRASWIITLTVVLLYAAFRIVRWIYALFMTLA